MTLPNGTHHPLSEVSERIDALEGHLAQLLARQRQGRPASDGSSRIVRTDLQFDEGDDTDGFDQRFNTFTDNTEVDERSRSWLLS